MKIADTILDLIGNTPLVKLNKVTEGISATVLVKLEYFNPGGSAKDRIATRIIDAAERDGLLLPGGTIVEPTSGNTGVGLALVAQQRGYRCVFVLPDKVGEDKRNVLTAYGAEVVVTPTSVAPDDPESYYSVSDRLAREIPGAFKPNQYANPNGPLSHYESTGPEIWRDTDGTVTHFVAGVGTGGTITGTGRYLREVSGDGVRIIGADPEGSVYSGGTGRPYLVEGVGEDFWPAAYDPAVVHEVIAVSDADSFAMTRRLALEEGILVGGSSGMAVVAALRAAATLPADAVVVVLLPDGGRGYLGKIFNDKWMRSYGFSNAPAGHTVADLLESKTGTLPAFVYVHPIDTVRDAIEAMTSSSVSQLLVLTAKPPVVMGEVLGAIDERHLMELVFSGEANLTDKISAYVGDSLPMIGVNEPVAAARAAFAHDDALLVTAEGKPLGVITRHDLLTYLSA
ncbi:cystathionine beta-synthase [Cryobacterium breve]|jgi:cystathionine beta-synthase|uniref:Cystathionine beta-synthase n=1 Tax=Cryobacterium breve TaxID=1259258 RepID=A0ABY7NHK9_9MICO|nr:MULTISPECIES: cystathionine beta-synthase [Cryobacterium]MDY7541663.1 cystathionine beta-synthase [Cryobacterium sp. 5B3]MEA9999044.1 cystathionine beta-synthase [Cryobacterium sp. RTS3]MEB0266381.1 cystathionine beta-synthase [Cryobacterium sp. 10I5]MEB0275886.1 cystathionine beta-synthase [Cryobacterium sp. 5B3]WBM81262.1 cystathionine beta-synthase [Cryobacterium breve]